MNLKYALIISLLIIAGGVSWWLTNTAGYAITWPLQSTLAGLVLGNSMASEKKNYWRRYAAGFVLGFGSIAAFYGLIVYGRQ